MYSFCLSISISIELTSQCCYVDDKSRNETSSRAKRRIEESRIMSEDKKAKIGLQHMNTSEKISMAKLSVQRMRMSIEMKQTKLLSFATQEHALMSQIDSARQLALIVCPVYDENYLHWKRVISLMDEQRDLSRKISEVTEDNNFESDEYGNMQHADDSGAIPNEIDVEDSSIELQSNSSVMSSPKKQKHSGV